jgi:hypothetical protein
MNDSALDQHMAVVGRVIAKFVSDGLAQHDIDSRGAKRFLGSDVDKKTFENVLTWMIDEDIIRVKNMSRVSDGTMFVKSAQLTSKGITIVREPTQAGDTIEKRIQSAGDDSGIHTKIGEMVGGVLAGFAKGIGSG